MQKQTLEQWRALAAVVDAGGYAAAAEKLGKSQSSVSYLVNQLQAALQVPLLELQGRRSVLTEAGTELLRRARVLLQEAQQLEDLAGLLNAGGKAELGVAVEPIVPTGIVVDALAHLAQSYPQLRVELYEPVLSGVTDLMLDGRVELAITSLSPAGMQAELLGNIRMIAVGACGWSGGRIGHPAEHENLSLAQLREERQLVLRDSGVHRRIDAGWLGSHQRWVTGSHATSLALVQAGLGYAWLPEHIVSSALASGTLETLPLPASGVREVPIFLVRSGWGSDSAAHASICSALKLAFAAHST